MGKRGVGRHAQLAVFVMVGLLLLIGVSLLLFLTYNAQQKEPLSLVPAEVRPVYSIIDGCTQSIAEQAIRRLSLQGGYLDLPPEIGRNPTSYVMLDDAGFMRIPMWYYDGEDRTPPVPFMEAALADEIRAGLIDCIDFSVLPYTVTPEGELRVNVTLAADNVAVRVNYPLSWQSAGKTVSYADYITQMDVRLLDMWELANATMAAENKDSLFENATIDLLALDPDVPMDDMSFDCTPQRWRLSEISSHVQDVLKTNIPSIRLQNTDYPGFESTNADYERIRRYTMEDINAGRAPSNVPRDSYEYLRLFWDVGVDKPAIRAGFSYEPRWGIALTGNPNDNGMLESRVARGSDLLRFMCVNTYHITYDLIYPVMLTLRDDKAFRGTGATFSMAFPVIIKTNSPDRRSFGMRSFRGFNFATGFCDDIGDTMADLRAEGVVADDRFATELEGVNFTLRCIGRECPLGQTQADEGTYRLRVPLPRACVRPVVVASKPGYAQTSGQLEGESMTLRLRALRNVTLTIQKRPYDLDTKKLGDAQPLGSVENVTLSISLPNSTIEQFLTYPAQNTLQLVDGTAAYDVTALLAQFGQLTGGYVDSALEIDSTTETLTLTVIEGRPVGFDDDYRGKLSAALYGNDYQSRVGVTR